MKFIYFLTESYLDRHQGPLYFIIAYLGPRTYFPVTRSYFELSNLKSN